MVKVFIDGSEGTTGLRIKERLNRNDVEILQINDILRKDPTEKAKIINQSDVTFLCLPDIEAQKSVALVKNPNTVIIDASTIHRTNHDFAYGFPELGNDFRNKIKTSKRIAVPGCHASGVISLIYPLIKLNLVFDYPFSAFSLTGYSGGGKNMIKEYETSNNQELCSPRMYGLNQMHKHIKEIKYICNIDNIVFNPIVDDYYSGMLVSIPLHIKRLGLKKSEIYNAFRNFYNNQELIKVLPLDINESYLSSNFLAGKDYMEIIVTGNEDVVSLTSRFDNLGKGASGAAIECLNIILGKEDSYQLKKE